MLLFDLGYCNFEWFDTLTQRGIWWVARLRSNGSYSLEHILVQRDGYFEALIFLGAYLLRLVRVRYRKDHAPGSGSHAHPRPKTEPGVI